MVAATRPALAVALIAALAAGCKKRRAEEAKPAAAQSDKPLVATPEPDVVPPGRLQDLDADDDKIRLRAVRRFVVNPPEEGPVLHGVLERMDSPRPEVRLAAATVLTYVTSERALAPLKAALEDADALVRFQALKGLAQRGDPSAVPGVVATLGGDDRRRVAWAAQVVGTLEAREHWRALIPLLDADNAPTQMAALRSIGRLGDADATAVIVGALAGAKPMIARQVGLALRDLQIDDGAKIGALAPLLEDQELAANAAAAILSLRNQRPAGDEADLARARELIAR